MKIGLVCPYSLDVPGGVQNHVLDLAAELIDRGHQVSVIAPGEGTGFPDHVVTAGRAMPVPYNGAVGRVMFGPMASARVRRWLSEGAFDVVHVHEPAAPSLSLIALGAADVPVVATFHTANPRSRAMSAASGFLRPRLEKIAARIAVSEYARDTLVQHIGGEPVVIPNGVYVDRFREAQPRPEWAGSIVFIGRIDEPRKGFQLLLDAFTNVETEAQLVVVGGGEATSDDPRVVFLGRVDDETKAALLASCAVYVAPNTGGESFGIVLVEAMAAGAPVLASDIDAFRRVLGNGRLGALFTSGDVADLQRRLTELLADRAGRSLLAKAASVDVERYDWSRLGSEIERVYETVVGL